MAILLVPNALLASHEDEHPCDDGKSAHHAGGQHEGHEADETVQNQPDGEYDHAEVAIESSVCHERGLLGGSDNTHSRITRTSVGRVGLVGQVGSGLIGRWRGACYDSKFTPSRRSSVGRAADS